MFLTRLYRHIMEANPPPRHWHLMTLLNESMRPHALNQTQKTSRDRNKARHSVSSSSSHHHGTSSHQHDDDDDDVKLYASTPSPTTYLNTLIHSTTKTTKCSVSEHTDETLLEHKPH
ncbi:hypothetical protein Tco_1483277 [Tanacetum coccineum]